MVVKYYFKIFLEYYFIACECFFNGIKPNNKIFLINIVLLLPNTILFEYFRQSCTIIRMNKKLIKKLKQTRIASSVSVYKLALRAHISPSSVSNIESGKGYTIKNVAKIITALELNIKDKLFLAYLKKKRESLGFTLEKMARSSGISQSIIYGAEHGIMPSIKTCCIIAKELDMPLEDFIEWPDDKKSE